MKKPKAKIANPNKPPKSSPPNKANSPDPQEINALIVLFSEGRYTEAATLAQTMTATFPHHAFGWKALGVMYKQMGQSANALAPMQMTVALSPSDAEAHYNLGVTLMDLVRLDEAEASYRQALQITPDYAEAHNNLGNTLKDLGRPDEAEASYRRALQIKPDYAEAHINLGVTLKNLGRPGEAEACYRQALQIKPDFADAHNNLGVTLMDSGRLDEAEASYRRALQIKPDYAEAHINLANALIELGRSDEAEASYRQALKITPDYAEAHNNLANALKNLGRPDEAEASYRRALQIKPDFAEAHNNLGVILMDVGRLDEAEASYRQALQIKPDDVEAHNNLAVLFNELSNSVMALRSIIQSLQIKETTETKRIFVDTVKHLHFMHDDSEIRAPLIRALVEPWGRPSEIVNVCTSLVKLSPEIAESIASATNAWPQRLSARDLFGSNGLSTIAANPLLCALLQSAPVSDIEMERFLTMARCSLLESATAMAGSGGEAGSILSFHSALAQQCFINEYVFSLTDDEIRKAGELRDALVAALEAQTPIPVLWPVAVAAYFPLYALPLAARLLDTQWPNEVTAMLVQQISEPQEELQLRATIPKLTKIEDEVSLLVQNQYEENPYPRWMKPAPAKKPETVDAAMHRRFPLVTLQPIAKSDGLDILIAGCGTGQHAIDTAQKFRGARVLAVDLSMTSLCYARRKAQELGLTSIEYAQADLMRLTSSDRSFDLIESVGVLHHLADPLAGWGVLLSLLRPGGIMKLGFYSELARRHIVRIRNLIAGKGYGSTANEIRRFRQELMGLDKGGDFGGTCTSSDFFSISNCRDLLFHTQEHRLTLPEIDVFLRKNNLSFLGFDIDPQVTHAYKGRFPDDRAAINLAQWHQFENENPDTFWGMYQFYIQKPV